ncbi:MAG: alpha-glucosidase/alpha-galactosidase, partial [Chloroflexi bacterium]|nr:alpha-glucosidase/alpha-galactosidase [Chloroflexota bacterium]
AHKVVKHYKAPTKIAAVLGWRNGVLEGANYVITSFAQGGPAYRGVPYHYEISIPKEFGIYQGIGDTAGIGGVFRLMRTAPEMVAIGKDMEKRCPGAYLINYVNPMSMLTRVLNLACPRIHTLGLCHNIGYSIRDIAEWLKHPHKEFRYVAAGVNHMNWFLRLEYLDGRSAYPDLLRAAEDPTIYKSRAVQFELLKHFGYWTTESSWHCAEYLPYFVPRQADREAVFLRPRETTPEYDKTAPRWSTDSDLIQQLDGRKPLALQRSFEYGAHIIHALETDAVYRMHLNVLNDGMITNLPNGYCVEVPCIADRTGVRPQHVGALPIHLAALCRGLADMQTLASDAFLERDLVKAYLACAIDPATAASSTPARIKECFNRLLKVEGPWLEDYWGTNLHI